MRPPCRRSEATPELPDNASDEGKQAIFDGPESRTLNSNIRVTLCHCHENPLSEMDLEDEVFGKYIVTFQNKTPD